ncbi:hypothetical protein [Ruminococcus sp. Marseille-P6503]|uniref:hypothetical protein n=1 Tax=Ruminococcus sp. Marseille-P6503 TaxID=2364796 RepID=UPI000F537C82|nr:hypothetical protein [Ruminococcus sp. Marseille-P6503]
MKRLKKIIDKILFPPARIIILCALTGFPAVFLSLTFIDSKNPVSYISYVLSAYALTVLCVNFPRAKRRCKELVRSDRIKALASFRKLMKRYRYTSMYLESREFRAKTSLYIGLAINILYAVFKCATGAVFRSAWLWAIGVYYVMLSAIRFVLLRNVRITDKKEQTVQRRIHEYKSARLCGVMMLALNIAMTGMTVQMIWRNRGYEYEGYVIYISAIYAFYCLINAIVNVVKFAKINNPILSAAKLLSLAGALMSMFALQTAMFSSFGGGESYRRLMNTVTGGIVCASVLGIAVFIIAVSNKKLKETDINALQK